MPSRVAQLKEEIDIIGQSMRLGLKGISCGSARHSFIREKHEALHACQEELSFYVGADASIAVLAEAYEKISERIEE